MPARDNGTRRPHAGVLPLRRILAGLALTAVALPALTAGLVQIRGQVELPSVLLLFLLLVVAASAVGGQWVAAPAAVAASLLANYYFTPPTHRWTIAEGQHVIALIVFVVVAEVVSALVTITARRSAATERARAEGAELAAGNELRTAILAAVSHDLRTPLASIKAAVTSLRQPDVEWPHEATAEFLFAIEEDTDRLNRLVGNLLDMSRLQTGALHILEREVGLDEVVPAALDSLGDRAAGVASDVPETLPRVRADPALLERAVANVVANAITWSPPGQAVAISARANNGNIDLRVMDRGPGIRAGDRDRVFQPFQRLGDSHDSAGVGLGLAVARGFLQAMGGQVTVEDTPGGGVTMVLSVPAGAR